MTTAAIFDLDRTLIAGSSAQVFAQKLGEVGIEMPAPPGQNLYFGLYERFGEDPVTMRLARYAARLFAGHSVRTVETAGRLAADVLSADLLDGAKKEIERCRREGTVTLLATTAPAELAEPLAALVGIDAVIATKYRAIDGTYDGTNAGGYLWGATKAAAVAEWAGTRGASLRSSSAYSDSWYDLPLLRMVGTPVAVNPDLRLRAFARARGWRRERWGETQHSAA